MSTERTPRQVLAEADRARAVVRWTQDMQCSIRLGRPIKLAEMEQRGPFGRKRKYLYELDDRMPAGAIDAIYRALSIVRDEAESKVQTLESQITVSGPQA